MHRRRALDDELRADIVEHKADLLRILSWSRRSVRATGIELERADRDAPLPLSWAQQRLWFLDQLEPGNAAYNISWTVRLRGALDREALQRAFIALGRRHETLRTVFPSRDGEPEQRVLEEVAISLPCEDMRGVPEEQLRARLNVLAGHAFDLARGPLVLPVLLQLADDEHILLVVVHHIVADGASMRILFRELAACYEADLEGREVMLPALPVQYADYSVWQRRWLDSGEIERQGEYWCLSSGRFCRPCSNCLRTGRAAPPCVTGAPPSCGCCPRHSRRNCVASVVRTAAPCS